MEAQEETLGGQQRKLPRMQPGSFGGNVCEPPKVTVFKNLDTDVRQRGDVRRIGHPIVFTTPATRLRI